MNSRILSVVAVAALSVAACSGGSDNHVASPIEDMGGTTEPDTSVADAASDVASDVDPDVPAEPGSLVIDPTQITFDDVRQGESATATIAISNVGGEPLVVTNVELTEFRRTGEPELLTGDPWDESFVLGGGLFRELQIVYEPKDYGVDQGQVRLFTNDPDNEIVDIRIQTVSAYADIEAPQFLRFGEVQVGDELTKRITVYNRGLDPLTIQDVAIGGVSESFFVTFEPSAIPPTVLEKDQDFIMDVRYAPLNGDTDRGTITITSDDPDEETYDIALTGNDPVPCLDVNPDVADFGVVTAGSEEVRQITLLNCSRTLNLDVDGVELTDDGGGVFQLDGLPEFPLQITPLQTVQFDVTGALADPGVAAGEVEITSDDPKSSGILELRLKVGEEP